MLNKISPALLGYAQKESVAFQKAIALKKGQLLQLLRQVFASGSLEPQNEAQNNKALQKACGKIKLQNKKKTPTTLNMKTQTPTKKTQEQTNPIDPALYHNPSEPIPLNATEVADLASANLLNHVHKLDIQPALRTQDTNGNTLLHELTAKGVPFGKYPPGTLTLQDLLQKNKNGVRPIDIALNKTNHRGNFGDNTSNILHDALSALSIEDAEKLLKEAKKNGFGRCTFTSQTKNKEDEGFEM